MNPTLFPETKPSVSIEAQIECAQRELSMRAGVYPRLVQNGKISQRQADKELQAMEAIVETLRQVKQQRIKPEP